MTDIFLLRHGETEWNAEGRFQGKLDSPLTARGRDQAAKFGSILSRTFNGGQKPSFQVSPLGRAQETAAIVSRYLEAPVLICVEPRLQEVSAGVWDGLRSEDIKAGWPGALDGTDNTIGIFVRPMENR